MRKTLLVIERIVVESLERQDLNFKEIEEQTGLSEPLLKSVLHHLRERGIVHYKYPYFGLCWERKEEWLPFVQDKEGMKAEIKELFSSLVNQIFKEPQDSTLKVQKIWLDKREKEELERRLRDIDAFLDSVRVQRRLRPVKEKTNERQVLFYGTSSYQSLVDGLLKAG